MEKEDIILMKQLFKDLEEFLKKYGDNSIRNQFLILRKVNNNIDIANNDLEIIQIEIAEGYRMLFSNRGGLSEFYIWDNDYQIRIKKNAPFDTIKEKMWSIMKKYR